MLILLIKHGRGDNQLSRRVAILIQQLQSRGEVRIVKVRIIISIAIFIEARVGWILALTILCEVAQDVDVRLRLVRAVDGVQACDVPVLPCNDADREIRYTFSTTSSSSMLDTPSSYGIEHIYPNSIGRMQTDKLLTSHTVERLAPGVVAAHPQRRVLPAARVRQVHRRIAAVAQRNRKQGQGENRRAV
jgi:hypothetical protein